MNKEDLLKELDGMSAKKLIKRLENPKLSNQLRGRIMGLWYSVNRKKGQKMTKIDHPENPL